MERVDQTPQAVSGISSPDAVRVVIFINNQMVHCPLNALLQHMQDQIDALDARVTALETP